MKKYLLLLALILPLFSQALASNNVVIKYDVDLLSEPSWGAADYIEPLSIGTILSVLSEETGWLKVLSPDGAEGYVASKWTCKETEECGKKILAKKMDLGKQKKLAKEKEITKERERFEKKRPKIAAIEKELKSIPVSQYTKNLELYRKLMALDPTNDHYWNKLNFYKEKLRNKKVVDRNKAIGAGYSLELINWSWHEEHGYVSAVGQVKNLTSKRLFNIQVVVVWYDSSHNLITYEDTLVEYDPIMPGQTTPFKVSARYNPMMSSADIVFKKLGGGTLLVYQDKD